MQCRFKLDGRVTAASFCKKDLSIVSTRYVCANTVSYLELFNPISEEKSSGLNYSCVFSKQVEEPVSCITSFSQHSSPSEGFFAASSTGSLRCYSVGESLVREINDCEKAHTGAILALDYCSKNRILFSGGSDGALKVWDVRCFDKGNGEVLRFVPISSGGCCCISHCGTTDMYKVFIGTQNGNVCLYDTRVNRDDAMERFSFPDSISSMFAVATSTLVVSTLSQVYKVNFLLANKNLLYQNEDTILVGVGRSPYNSNELSVADRTKRLLLVDCKSGFIRKSVISNGKGYWTKVSWHSGLPVYLAISYKSLQVGVFPHPARSIESP